MRRAVIIGALGILAGCAPAATPLPDTQTKTTAATVSMQSTVASSTLAAPASTVGECELDLPFQYSLVDLDAIEYITPLGLMFDSHVTPVDHIYFQNFADMDRWIDVFAPADGVVTSIQHFGAVLSDAATPIDDYRLVIEHGCGVSSILIHIDEVNASLMAVAPLPGEYANVNVALVAGEQIGRFTANLDLTIADERVTIPGLLEPDSYVVEPWKIHTPDPFAYFAAGIRERMEALSLRTDPPYAGTFAWDVDGRLVGNWFEVGTNGYGGSDPSRYWSGHLSFAYDHLDHSMVKVSIGTFAGLSEQLGVLGNGPDPATVGAGDGVVAYELVDWDYWVGDERWSRMGLVKGIEARSGSFVVGTILVELLDDRVLRFEAFPGLTASEVDGFTASAKQFER